MLVRHHQEAGDVALFDLSASPAAAATFMRSQTIEAFAEGAEPPEWVMIMPLPGADAKLQARDGRRLFITDLAALVRTSNDSLARQGGPGPVDKDHEISWRGGGPVIGWAHEFQTRGDGVYARVEWLPEAQQLIREKKYRYTSVVVAWKMANIKRDEKWGFIVDFDIEPTVIRGFGITNIPALEVRAMFSQENRTMSAMQRILARFGLAETATPEQLEQAIEGKFSAQPAAPSLDHYVPRADYDRVNAELSTARTALKDEQDKQARGEREQLLAEALKAGKVIPATADFYRQSLEQPGGVERFKKFLETAPVIAAEVKLPPVAGASSSTLSAAEQHACRVAGITPEQYTAEREARRKKPAA
ncbi:MAG: hypothetical protein JNL82_14425 [Myxococcales bacterium]|nr:hypothetical protein [Myxococcales bacterium]